MESQETLRGSEERGPVVGSRVGPLEAGVEPAVGAFAAEAGGDGGDPGEPGRGMRDPDKSAVGALEAVDVREGARLPESVDDPEGRLAQLAAASGPLRRLLAALAARLVATRAWERLCYARLSDYARERPGLSARQIQELARVHGALAKLPALEGALVGNELPWSKVRELARVARPETEGAWIAEARRRSVRALAGRVREHRARERVREGLAPIPPRERESEREAWLREAARIEREERREAATHRVVVRCTPAVRERWEMARELAERSAGSRLPVGDALEVVVAEALSGVPLDPGLAPEPDGQRAGGDAMDGLAGAEDRALEGEGGAPTPPPRRAPAPALPAEVDGLAAGLEEADAFELDRRLRCAVALEQTLDAAIAPLLRVVASAEYEWRGERAWPLGVYAAEQLGMSVSKARALVRLERAGEACPALREAYRAGRLSWAKAQLLLPLLGLDLGFGGDEDEGTDWRGIWVDWAARVTVRRLQADVERLLRLRATAGHAVARCLLHPETTQDALAPGEEPTCAQDAVALAETEELVFRVPEEVASLYRGLRETFRGRLVRSRGRWPTDGEVFDAIVGEALAAWTLREPGARRPDPVMERDRYLCAVPGCGSRSGLHDHHVVYRSRSGSNALENRVALCWFHHQRCLHAGRMRVEGRAPDGLLFELGVRPERPPLVRYRSGDVLVAAAE